MLNLGILAHVDAGKTSLTERLLHAAGVIDEIGSVDAGSTQTDTLELERRRGITIKAAVASFPIGDVTVNLIDTPGHPDFIAEVERSLGVLDGAVLVVSAVEGVQAQTRVLMRALRRLRIPTLIFVNKMDRAGADFPRVLDEITGKLAPAVDRNDHERLAEYDDEAFAAFVEDRPFDADAALARVTAAGTAHPVFRGSAITGDGIAELTKGIHDLLPSPENDGPTAGTVFKVERGPAGEKIAYVRMFAGTIAVRDRLPAGKVTAISVAGEPVPSVHGGQIGKLWGLAKIRIGDRVGSPSTKGKSETAFAPPSLSTVVIPDRAADRGRLRAALGQLAEQDPLINVRQDEARQEISVSLYGEVQKEVIQATLHDEYGIDVHFRETTTICVERPAGTGEAVEFMNGNPGAPFLGTVGLRVEPGPAGSGVTYRIGVELGSMPFAFMKAVEETVHETLREGLHGWSVVDCVVTLTHSGYAARQSHAHAVFDKSMSSTAGDFRNLTPLVLMAALREAGTTVFEPMHRFHLDLPTDTVSDLLPVLARLRGVPLASGEGTLDGILPASNVYSLQQVLPARTRGEGVLESAFDHYAPVRGRPPERERLDHNPLNRREYLLRVQRRVPTS
jgi:ribosomal protection tetracycline resistance protein